MTSFVAFGLFCATALVVFRMIEQRRTVYVPMCRAMKEWVKK
jgi:hypothetical protein